MANARALMALVVAACGFSALLSITQGQHLWMVHMASREEDQSGMGERMDKLLQAFPEDVKALEERLLKLEQAISEAAGVGGSAALAAEGPAAAPAPLPPPPPPAAPAPGPAAGATAADGAAAKEGQNWREDKKCGGRVPTNHGKHVGCDPSGTDPCCSPLGWCGNTAEHCECQGCVDFRKPPPVTVTLEPPPPKDHHEGRTVVVVIPFRDREGHLVNFKKYWRWFAKEGNKPPKVKRWEIFVAEQFDAKAFNRGWNFNMALAIASAQKSASPEVKHEMGIDFDCAVIQDIDYLPEAGVDYGECEVPMQLSSEIDRYNGRTPYVQNCGGIVSMRLKHWRKINGFGNEYYGWGGEDDELFHRLRLNGLLYGDCYPFCAKNDPYLGKTGKSIKRPRKGFGRFSGKYMHSANHTKRITDSKAYDRNLKMLAEITNGGTRWKTDGLSNLAFRIVGYQIDRTDTEAYGITYHHVRARKGTSPFNLRAMPFALPSSVCAGPGEQGLGSAWSLYDFHSNGGMPWSLESLRAQLAKLAAPDGGACPGAAGASFVLLDRRRNLAKVLSDDDPKLLVVFYRSLDNPATDGLIIADPRPKDVVHEAFRGVGAYAVPPSSYSVCASGLKEKGPKYSVHEGPICGGGGWAPLKGGVFKGYARKKDGLQAITFCDNEKHWIQRMVAGEACEAQWNELKWVHGGTFWVPQGNSYCIGTRAGEPEFAFSRLLPQESCKGDGFSHELGFGSVEEEHALKSATICIGVTAGGSLSVAQRSDCDQAPNGDSAWRQVARFAARAGAAAGDDERLLCVESSGGEAGDVVREGGTCGSGQKLVFAVPKASRPEEGLPAAAKRQKVCVFPPADLQRQRASVGADCEAATDPDVIRFEAASLLDILAFMPGAGSSKPPLFTVVEEEIPCFPFLCPHTLQNQS